MGLAKYAAKNYLGSDWKAPGKSAKNGLCLSGGGSRALSAGLGQLIGLNTGQGRQKALLDSIDYISSVSGGTWLTSIFSFSENQQLDDLLGVYAPPDTLTEENIGDLSAGSIGHVPGRLSYSDMIDIVHKQIGLINIIKYPQVRKWVWPVIVGELVLKPYRLYQGSMAGSGKDITPMPERFFSLDLSYMQENIKALSGDNTNNGALTADDFYFHQNGRPFPIMNTNLKLDYRQSDTPLLPVQGTPVAVGATGKVAEADLSLSADGAVESFAFTSSWLSQSQHVAMADIDRRYSLIDLVSCSSAFFAETVGKQIAGAAAAFSLGSGNDRETGLSGSLKEREAAILADLSSLVPQYNYWPVGAQSPVNQNTGFADGGNLDNTGLLGMLARSDAANIVVCYNSESALGSREDISVDGYHQKIARVSADIPILFGYQPKPVNGSYVRFSACTPADLKYLQAAQVFEPAEFGPLVTALFAASQSEKAPAVARTKSLNVCDNAFAGIRNRGRVDVLWLYNSYAENWVDEIHKNSWQLADNIRIGRHIPGSDFHNFPNYSTALQINLNATQVNALAQYQAWVINQVRGQIQEMFIG